MPKQATEIEVEVLEIDGATPVITRPEPDEQDRRPHHDWQDWRQWQGRVSRLDGRWWPLWVFLGIIALGLFLTLGLAFAIVFVIIRFCLKIIRAILR